VGALTTAACVLALPATLAHEATHYAAARVAGTDDATIAVEVTGAGAVAAWRPIDSRPLEMFAFLAPTVFGSVLAALWLATGVDLRGWELLFGAGLAVYTAPSAADIRGALGRQEITTEQCQTNHQTDYSE